MFQSRLEYLILEIDSYQIFRMVFLINGVIKKQYFSLELRLVPPMTESTIEVGGFHDHNSKSFQERFYCMRNRLLRHRDVPMIRVSTAKRDRRASQAMKTHCRSKASLIYLLPYKVHK